MKFGTKIMNKLTYKIALSILALAFVSACSAGSMRIDVEVYKGPLSKPEKIQIAELQAMVENTHLFLEIFEKVLSELNDELEKDLTKDKEKKANLKSFGKNIETLKKTFKGLKDQGVTAGSFRCAESNNEANTCILLQIAKAGQQLKSSAFHWSNYLTFTYFPKEIRKGLVDYAHGASQLGNQLTARSDALHKQLTNGKPREMFPLGDYLQDTRPTEFLSLYDWLNATDFGLFRCTFCNNEQRVNVFSHLFDDNFWSNINTVYATGMGDTNMAFAKDEIGNWTLKSFGSDPTKMVDAYANLTLASLKTAAASLAPGSAAINPELLNTISKLTSGQLGSGVDPKKQSKMEEFRKEALDKLEDLKTAQDKQKAIEEAKAVLKEYKEKLDMLENL